MGILFDGNYDSGLAINRKEELNHFLQLTMEFEK